MRALRGFLVIGCMFIAAPLFAFHPQWVQKSTVSSARVNWIATGDFDEDGHPDAVDATSQTLTLHLVNPDGTLRSPGIIVQADGDLSEPVVGDLNGDHHLDVVVGDNSAFPGAPAGQTSLLVYPGNGDGTFGSPIRTALTFSPTEIYGGDFNNDGKLDLVIRSYASALLAVYSSDGAGHFTEVLRASPGESLVDVAVGDIDHDGNADIAVVYWDGKPFQIYFGHGDATFDAPVDYVSSSPETQRVTVADLDHDQDLELLFTDFNHNSLTVAVNTGSRTFATPVAYSTGDTPYGPGDPFDLAVDDFDQDGNADVVVVLINTKALATFLGNGNGTLQPAVRSSVAYDDFPFVVAVADITGDSRPDVFIGSHYAVSVFENRAGDVSLNLRPNYPTITVGQPAQFLVETCFAAEAPYFCSSPLIAHGTVTLRENGNAIGSGVLSGGLATIDVTSPLSFGTHSITAEYSGDSEFHPATSYAVVQKVINEQTTTTLSSNAAGPDVEYGQNWTLTGTVTSPLPGSLNGSIWLFTNDVRSQYTQTGPTTYWFPRPLPGTYYYYAKFEGTATQPPSTSAVFTQVVRKGRTIASISYGPSTAQAGTPVQLAVEAHTPFVSSEFTNVKLYEGSTLLGDSGSYSFAWISVNLPVGVHYLQAVYDGNDKFDPARSQPFRFTVLPAGFVLNAYASGTTVGLATYSSPSGNLMYRRRVGNGAWQPAVYMNQAATLETNLAPGVYSYRAEVHDYSTQQIIATSNIDVAIVGANFSDDPLVAGQPVRAAHISELVAATNTLLAAGGLPPLTISDAGVGQPVRASHITALRDAINSARTALGMMSPQWADTIAPSGILRAAQILEMRDALR